MHFILLAFVLYSLNGYICEPVVHVCSVMEQNYSKNILNYALSGIGWYVVGTPATNNRRTRFGYKEK